MPPRDLRSYTRQTNVRLVIGAVLLFLIVGEGLIYWRYGPAAAVSGLMCFGIGLVPLGLILVVLWMMDWIVKRAKSE